MTDIFTPATGVTILSGAYAIYGKVISITMGLKSTTAITAAGLEVGFMKTSYIPAAEGLLTVVVPAMSATAGISTNGSMKVRGTISANTNFYMMGTYLTV